MRPDEIGPIILSYEERIRRFFSGKICARDDVEDLTQEAICGVISAAGRFEGRSSVATWIYAVCRHVLYTYWHRRRRHRDTVARLAALFSVPETPPPELALLLPKLPARLKTVYTLFYAKRYKIEEIAALLGAPAGTVKYRLHELRSALRRELM